jgi:DNA polymerase-1
VNLQQIPGHGDVAKTIRSSFIASEGYKLICADFSGFELAIIAEFSQDPVWLKVLNNKGDLHGELCAMTFNIPISDIRKPFPHKPSFTYRDVQKTVDFMLAYGGSEYKLSDVIQVDIKEAKKIIKTFFSKVPRVKKFLDTLGELGKTRGYISTPHPFKRTRWFPKWTEKYKNYKTEHLDKEDYIILGEIERASKNSPIQGTNANLIKYSLVKLQEEIETNDWNARILLTVHDEIIVEVQEDQAQAWKETQEKIMIACAKTVLKTVTIGVEAKISDFWIK